MSDDDPDHENFRVSSEDDIFEVYGILKFTYVYWMVRGYHGRSTFVGGLDYFIVSVRSFSFIELFNELSLSPLSQKSFPFLCNCAFTHVSISESTSGLHWSLI